MLGNRFIVRLCASFTLVASISGCSDNTILEPPDFAPAVRVDAVIEVSSEDPDAPHRVEFGEVAAGDCREQALTIKNVGTDTLQVQDLVLPDWAIAFEIVNREEVAPLLAPEMTTTAMLSYCPRGDEHAEATLTVASNDRDTPEVDVRLLAEGLAPSVRLDPPSFDFGSSELGCVGELSVEIANVGRANLVLNTLWFEDLGGSGEMSVQHDIQPGTLLAPGESRDVTVTYVPSDVEPDTGVLHVESNDPSAPDRTATQFGMAHLGEGATDAWTPEGSGRSDILFVVDNSGSMHQEQTSLAANFSAFVQILEALDLDYHLGVVTTDVGDGGDLQGSVPIVTSSTPDPSGTFAQNVNLGTSGSGSEQAFQSAYLALNGSNPNNDGFLRDDAGLRIIFVSDEQEQSTALGGPQDYVDFFLGLKANPEQVVISDISGGLAGCAGPGGSASSGSNYVAASVATGGISASICDSNWVATLSALAWMSQSYADTFELSQTPVEDTIEVRLNGVNVYVGWTFDGGLNAVLFDLDHLPDSGDTIEVEYTVLGACGD